MAQFNKTVGGRSGKGFYRHYSPVTKFVEVCTGDCAYGQNSTVNIDGREFVVLHADSEEELMAKIEHYEAAEAKRLDGAAGLFGTRKKKQKKAPKGASAENHSAHSRRVSAVEERISDIDSEIEQLEKRNQELDSQRNDAMQRAEEQGLFDNPAINHRRVMESRIEAPFLQEAETNKGIIHQRRIERSIALTTQRDPETNEAIDVPNDKLKHVVELAIRSYEDSRNNDLDKDAKKQAAEDFDKLTKHLETVSPTSSGYDAKDDFLETLGVKEAYYDLEAVSSEKPEINLATYRGAKTFLEEKYGEFTSDAVIAHAGAVYASDDDLRMQASPTYMALKAKEMAEGEWGRGIKSFQEKYEVRSLNDNKNDTTAETRAKTAVRAFMVEKGLTKKEALSRQDEAYDWQLENAHKGITTENMQVLKYLAKKRGLI